MGLRLFWTAKCDFLSSVPPMVLTSDEDDWKVVQIILSLVCHSFYFTIPVITALATLNKFSINIISTCKVVDAAVSVFWIRASAGCYSVLIVCFHHCMGNLASHWSACKPTPQTHTFPTFTHNIYDTLMHLLHIAATSETTDDPMWGRNKSRDRRTMDNIYVRDKHIASTHEHSQKWTNDCRSVY